MKIKFRKYWRKTSLKQKGVGDLFLQHVEKKRPRNFLEIGVFHGVTSRNVCELLYFLHGNDFKFTGIDPFVKDTENLTKEHIPNTKFSNPLKTIYYNYIIKLDPYSFKAVSRLLIKFEKNISIIKGYSNQLLKEINLDNFDYVFLDGGHQYETVKTDLGFLSQVIDPVDMPNISLPEEYSSKPFTKLGPNISFTLSC